MPQKGKWLTDKKDVYIQTGGKQLEVLAVSQASEGGYTDIRQAGGRQTDFTGRKADDMCRQRAPY